jgi:spermidine synthase
MASLAMTDDVTAKPFPKARFVATICAGSFLLFLVQPMIARMALPRLGGAPAVWNSAMLVYQALLLAGYGYAHWIGRFGARTQASIHLCLFALAALVLPIGLIASSPPPDASPFVWVPWLLLASIGPLFFVVAAQAPLMQRWFALSDGGDPYPLYAASNLGSFGGLIAYPLIVEPLMTVSNQSWLWSGGYIVLALLVAGCALTLPKSGGAAIDQPDLRVETGRKRVAMWILLSAVPSGLMLSTSTHLTTDIVAMPLLWVMPLGLYLLSFSVAFAENRRLAKGLSGVAALILILCGGPAFAESARQPILYAALGLVMLFVISVALHTALFNRRPDPSQLTAFYLAMSVGGVVGGLFCALIAPLIFDWGYEHPILIVIASLLVTHRPLFGWTNRLWSHPRHARLLRTALPLLAIVISMVAQNMFGGTPNIWVKALCALAIIDLTIIALGSRFTFGLCIAALMLSLGGWDALKISFDTKARTRSFFGTYTVMKKPGNVRTLVHGTTLHGIQNLNAGHERDTVSYYAAKSGIGQAMTAAPQMFGAHARIGVVGLGTGTLACYARPGQTWRFYEIDPAIVRIAKNQSQFTFLSRCAPGATIAVGDARLMLAKEKLPRFDMLAVDAFSSDAVPVHLLTREAFETYQQRLTPSGLLMIHISNRFLNLEPVLASEAARGWYGSVRDYRTVKSEEARHLASSVWVALSRDPATIAKLRSIRPEAEWRPIEAREAFAGWSDDYASILPLISLQH